VARVVYSANALSNLERSFAFLVDDKDVDAAIAALYRYVPSRHEVRILPIRHQRELDYP
jgi:plasmid stabilization system protein ParE